MNEYTHTSLNDQSVNRVLECNAEFSINLSEYGDLSDYRYLIVSPAPDLVEPLKQSLPRNYLVCYEGSNSISVDCLQQFERVIRPFYGDFDEAIARMRVRDLQSEYYLNDRNWHEALNQSTNSHKLITGKIKKLDDVLVNRGATATTSANRHEQTSSISLRNALSIKDAKPTSFLLKGAIQSKGIVLLVGQPAAGKTTNLVSLLPYMTGLKTKPLNVDVKQGERKVIYITEDPNQVYGVLRGMRMGGAIDTRTTDEEIDSWISVLATKRLDARFISEVFRNEYQQQTHAHIRPDGKIVELPPLVVLDTAAATIDLENENDNAEVSKAIDLLRAGKGDMTIIITAHSSKASKHSTVTDISARGAGAFEGNVEQVMVMHSVTKDKGDKGDKGPVEFQLEIAKCKKRFNTDIAYIEFETQRQKSVYTDEFGVEVTEYLVYSDPKIKLKYNVKLTQKEAEERQRAEELAGKRKRILDALQARQDSGWFYTSKNDLFTACGIPRKDTDVYSELVNERWIIEHMPLNKIADLGMRKQDKIVYAVSSQEHKDIETDPIPSGLNQLIEKAKKRHASESTNN